MGLPGWLRVLEYFYPRSPCGERPRKGQSSGAGIRISIHALLAESDQSRAVSRQKARRFLSTLSLRRATGGSVAGNWQPANFYPRSPCGERLFSRFWCIFYLYISIHALLAESDQSQTVTKWALSAFLSTLSLRRATTKHSTNPKNRKYFYPRSPCGERQRT